MDSRDELVTAGIERNEQVLQQLQEGEREERERYGDEMRVNIRWGRDQVNVIKRAAAALDVPYQIYIKQTVIKQALADLKDAEQALATVAKQ